MVISPLSVPTLGESPECCKFPLRVSDTKRKLTRADRRFLEVHNGNDFIIFELFLIFFTEIIELLSI